MGARAGESGLKREGKGGVGEHAPGPFGIMLERR